MSPNGQRSREVRGTEGTWPPVGGRRSDSRKTLHHGSHRFCFRKTGSIHLDRTDLRTGYGAPYQFGFGKRKTLSRSTASKPRKGRISCDTIARITDSTECHLGLDPNPAHQARG